MLAKYHSFEAKVKIEVIEAGGPVRRSPEAPAPNMVSSEAKVKNGGRGQNRGH